MKGHLPAKHLLVGIPFAFSVLKGEKQAKSAREEGVSADYISRGSVASSQEGEMGRESQE
jgi:hypothetical protein